MVQSHMAVHKCTIQGNRSGHIRVSIQIDKGLLRREIGEDIPVCVRKETDDILREVDKLRAGCPDGASVEGVDRMDRAIGRKGSCPVSTGLVIGELNSHVRDGLAPSESVGGIKRHGRDDGCGAEEGGHDGGGELHFDESI